MKTFDQILSEVRFLLKTHDAALVAALGEVVLNRDLNGRVSWIVSSELQEDSVKQALLQALALGLFQSLENHTFPAASAILYEENLAEVRAYAPCFQLEDFPNFWVVDRLVTESSWDKIAPIAEGAPRIVFFSVKGGVGRSTALAATAWWAAQQGHRVLVLDLDLESPGLSTSLLPDERQPLYGITDWLVEDLVNNGDEVLESMWATAPLSHDGEIFVVPAHGKDPGEYIAKLGRVWMPKVALDGSRENWSLRLQRLIAALEERIKPDVILLDSRAGIDEVAASCVTDLGAALVLLFAIEGSQTWGGYRILLEHWLRSGVIKDIRDRLAVVAALVPETHHLDYLEGLRENAYTLFAKYAYDDIPPGDVSGDQWHFEIPDELAPHAPWPVRWHRSFAGLKSLHGRLQEMDQKEFDSIFGSLVNGSQSVFN